MTREELPGYDVNHRTGDSPLVDRAVDALNDIVMPYGGGIACLDERGERVKRYTKRVVLELPDNIPDDVRVKARAAALSVLQAMQNQSQTGRAQQRERPSDLEPQQFVTERELAPPAGAREAMERRKIKRTLDGPLPEGDTPDQKR